VIQRILGHATMNETNETYTHVSNSLKRAEILKLDKAVNY
jgi:integrase